MDCFIGVRDYLTQPCDGWTFAASVRGTPPFENRKGWGNRVTGEFQEGEPVRRPTVSISPSAGSRFQRTSCSVPLELSFSILLSNFRASRCVSLPTPIGGVAFKMALRHATAWPCCFTFLR